jgi:hypothetical protein
MMKFPWFKDVDAVSSLEQGDILFNCNVLIPDKSHYLAILNNIETEVPVNIIQINAIVLSQSCDIVNDKINAIIVCPIWPLQVLIDNNAHFKSSKAREELRQGNIPSYHLLNKLKLENNNEEFYFVDFHNIYSIPKTFIIELIQKEKRIRLQPPYREHLSQAFARYFMRVGLPTDISKEDLKNLY